MQHQEAGPGSTEEQSTYVRTRELGEHAPISGTVGLDVVDEQLVLLQRPLSLLDPIAVAARSSSHGGRSLSAPSPLGRRQEREARGRSRDGFL
jgi:hypothetical protein